MRINVLSDLHLEKGLPEPTPFCKRDVTVLAGDIDSGVSAMGFILRLLKDSDVVYVPGNHEYYGGDIREVSSLWSSQIMARINQQALISGLPHRFYFLDNDAVTIKGVKFIGSTLWTDFDHENPLTVWHANRIMRDYQFIRHNGNLITPETILSIHKRSLKFIMNQLNECDGPAVVVTHHAPSFASVPAAYKGDILNGAFCNNLEEFIIKHCPNAWIHGHTHEKADYMIGKTQVACNPGGYRNEWTGFDPNFILEI